MAINNIVVLGASITNSSWLTWKDFLEIESNLPMRNLSIRGVGNEFMTVAILQNAEFITANTLVTVMLTNVDKFDWYVEGTAYHELAEQKHKPIAIAEHSGFWCTGSWFPEKKSVFKEHFYSLDYFCSKTIQQILLLKAICDQRGAVLQVLFDSPIWNYTEQDLNGIGANTQTINQAKKDLLSLPLSSMWANQIDSSTRSTRGLIGYCWDNGLDWYNPHYYGHPPSYSHWEYYTNIVKPSLSQWIKFTDCSKVLAPKIKKITELWNQC